ncbi:beta-L-arabinofuranosidase domain-containing protein [Pedobacter sp. AW31-3R]|uniref:beta-L-arabinofuranosidase domain-containing protein n=1 Tax=Pedobacter sp. AW31-3R TaxID=3445781 RepID=UPI003FA08380
MKRGRIYIVWSILSILSTTGYAQKTSASYQEKPLRTFPLSSVRLLESPFLQAQQTDMKYMLSLDPDRLLAPFLREAGLAAKKESYPNWENTGLDGHIGGHYISALSDMYAATGNKEVMERLNYMLDALEKCQQKDGEGYMGGVPGGKAMWKDIAAGKINAGSFSLNDKWVPLYNIHKLYAGLVDAYRLTGSEKAKKMLVGYADWAYRLTANLSDAQIQDMLRSEYGGLNESFADVAEITGDERYLVLARKFSQQVLLKPLLENKDELTGMHANTQIPKVIGFMRVAELSKDKSWAAAADFFWHTVVKNRSVSIGGNSVREHFHPVNDFSSMVESREGPETCNSYNMLKLSAHLFRSRPSAEYMDFYERTLYNHILSSQHPDGGFVYFTPMRPGHYKVYSQPQEGFWCCVGSGLENHGKYGEIIYAHNENDLFVNLFIASTLEWKEKGLNLVQETTFPESESSSIALKLNKAAKFAIHFRYPSWVKKGEMKLAVNGKEQVLLTDSNSYVSLNRKWKSGDVVKIILPMHTSTEVLPDQSDFVSFVHGPVVLAASLGNEGLEGLKADASRMGHIANGPLMSLEDAPLMIGAKDSLALGLQNENQAAMGFKASQLIYQEKYKDLELVPFYKLYDTRYIVYWPFTTAEKLPAILASRKEKEVAERELENMTVDKINTGEQQPESDHGFKGEKTWEGVFKERHFRSATGWFSYVLKNPGAKATGIRLTYFGADRDKNFDIYVNNVLLQTVKLEGAKGDQFYDVVYPLTAVKKGEKMELRFAAKPGSSVAAIYEVRLVK